MGALRPSSFPSSLSRTCCWYRSTAGRETERATLRRIRIAQARAGMPGYLSCPMGSEFEGSRVGLRVAYNTGGD